MADIEYVVQMKGITKVYPNGIAANQGVDFDVKKGEIHALMGENGAGKSTLMKMLFGLEQPTDGEIFVNGEKVNLSSPTVAISKGIGMVHQHFMLVPSLTVAENMVLGMEPKSKGFIDSKKAVQITEEYAKKYNLYVDPNAKVRDIPVGMKQKVEILKALVRGAKILILDEPTVGLDPKQIIEIRNLISRLGRNHTIILSSHILSEIQAVCKRVIIINKGQIIADDTPENLSDKLSSDHSIVARVVCSEQDMLDALKTVKGVKEVGSLGRKEDGSFDFLIDPQPGADIRGAVSERIASRGKTLLALTSNKVSLEQIFLRLTEAADNDEAKRMLGIKAEETKTDVKIA